MIGTKMIAAVIVAGAIGSGIGLAAPAAAEPGGSGTISCSPCDRWTEFPGDVAGNWAGYPGDVADKWLGFPGDVAGKWLGFPGKLVGKWTGLDRIGKKLGLG